MSGALKNFKIYSAVYHLQAMAPHLTAIAARIDELWAARKIWPGERCVMSDAIMLAASRAGDASLQSQARKQTTNSRWMSKSMSTFKGCACMCNGQVASHKLLSCSVVSLYVH